MKKEQLASAFLKDLRNYIAKLQQIESIQNSVTCANCFENDNNYEAEKDILSRILTQNFKNTKEQGDALENLVKSLFERILLVNNVKITTKDIALGQTDIQLLPIDDDDMLYQIWGIRNSIPMSIIGECKNYPKDSVGREEIEKICWRTCKGGCLSFFIAFDFTKPALDEIADFNNHKNDLCIKGEGALIVPITMFMLETIIENDINFCYFIRWAILYSKNMNIANYIQKDK